MFEQDHVRMTAADLLGVDTIGDGCMVTSAVMIISAVSMETGVEQLFVIEDDVTPPWKLYGMISYVEKTYIDDHCDEDDGENSEGDA